ncbi:hypothetical protein HK102_009403, partial [Quaeritorhiza haematococci]
PGTPDPSARAPAPPGKVDRKEGLYIMPEHGEENPRVKAGTPLYGKNQFPDKTLPDLRPVVLEYIDQVTELGHRMMELISLSLGLDAQYIRTHFTQDPIALVRLFSYPPLSPTQTSTNDDSWGIGAHTDYGLWTMLKQFAPGLQFESPDSSGSWVDIPFIEDAFVMNVGDVLDRMTQGRFKSRRHRARNLTPTRRLTIPFFFDPSWDAKMGYLPLDHLPGVEGEEELKEREERWSKTSIVELEGEYSMFLAKKVAKVFPDKVPASLLPSLKSTKGPSTRFAIPIPIEQ